MPKGKASGLSLSKSDAEVVMGMELRGDRNHDIAAWFGVNQGRIAEVKDGSSFGSISAAPANSLPPKGPPGIKGRKLRDSVGIAIAKLNAEPHDSASALQILIDASARYDAHEK
jgi:hypothetical protein